MENTSLTKDDINGMSLVEIEGLLEGFNSLHSTDDSQGDTSKLEGTSALQYLIDNQGTI